MNDRLFLRSHDFIEACREKSSNIEPVMFIFFSAKQYQNVRCKRKLIKNHARRQPCVCVCVCVYICIYIYIRKFRYQLKQEIFE